MQRVALLGLGVMGSGMARNLLRAGYPLTVYNRTRERAKPLEEAGAKAASTPREASEGADVVISIVADDAASRAVWLGENGAMAAVGAGAVLIECSTLSTAWVAELAEIARAKGCQFLDAPVTGSKPQAEAGELTFLVGGDALVLDRVLPVLKSMGQTIHHLGPTGSGATMKLVNNLLVGVQAAALAEALHLAESAGLDSSQVLDVLSAGAVGSGVMRMKGPKMLSRDYDTQFALRWMHKDLTYALDEAAGRVAPLPLVAVAREMYRMALARGLGDQDFAAIIEVVRQQ